MINSNRLSCFWTILTLFACWMKCFLVEGQYMGCYQVNRRYRSFAVSAGTYNTGSLNPTICIDECQFWLYQFAGLTEGQFCFCSNQLPTVPVSPDTYCNEPCSDITSGAMCGSFNYISVYEVNVASIGLELTLYGLPSSLVQIGTEVYLNLSRIDGPLNPYYAMNYDDKAGLTGYNETGMMQKSFAVPGEYTITASSNDTQNSEASVVMSVQAPVNYLQFWCPPEVAYNTEFRCNASLYAGTYVNLTINYGDGITEIFPIADPYYFTAGTGIPQCGTQSSTSILGDIYVMPMSDFQNNGYVLGFEFYATAPGTVTFLIFQPICTGASSYCYTNNNCGTTPCAPGMAYCANTGDMFCPRSGQCKSSCKIGFNRYIGNGLQNSYQIVEQISYVIPSLGYQTYYFNPITKPVPVSKGYIMGYVPLAGMIATRSLWPNETTDLIGSNVCTGSPCSTSPMVPNGRHLLRAIATKPASVLFFHTYTNTDLFSATLDVYNDLLPNAAHQYSNASILVAIGINASIIEAPPFAITNQPVHIWLLPLTGSNVTFLWDTGDGNLVNTTTPWLNYTYKKRGCYWVNNTAYNVISRKSSNLTLICVEDQILNVTVRHNISGAGLPTVFSLTMTSGSDYLCDWSYGDGSTYVTNPTNTLITGVPWIHKYASDGAYTVNVTCYNNVSSGQTLFIQYVQWPIVNLRLLQNGAVANNPFTITYLIDNGTNPSFNLTFDGKTIPAPYTLSTKSGTTASLVGYPLGIHLVEVQGWNLISSVTIYVNFTIELAIVNPMSICNMVVTVSGVVVTYTATVSNGSNVNITWNFMDGTPNDNYLGPSTTAGAIKQVQTHSFAYGGLYVVEVTISNDLNSYLFNNSIIVYGKIVNMTLLSTGPVPLINGLGPCNFTFTSPKPPYNAQLQFNYGNGVLGPTELFNINQIYPYVYMSSGTYLVEANISNPFTFGMVSVEVVVAVPIINMILVYAEADASLGLPFTIGIAMEQGYNVMLYFNFGDNSNWISMPRTGQNVYQPDNATHTYTAIGTYEITAIASNTIGNTTLTYLVIVQQAVLPYFVLTSTAPVPYPTGLVTFTLTYPPGQPLPTAASMTFIFGDGTNSAVMPLPFTTSSHSFTIPHQYLTGGNYVAQVVISNLASSQTFSIPAGVYTTIGNFVATALYQPALPYGGPAQPGFGPLQNTFPASQPLSIQATLKGTVDVYEVVITNANGQVVFAANFTSSPMSIAALENITANGNYKILVTAWSPLSLATASIMINVNHTVAGALLTVNPISAPPESTMTFTVSFTDVGTSTCAVVNFDDGTTQVYGNNIAYCKSVTSLPVSGALTNPLTINHVYTTPGTYNATLTAYDPMINGSSEVTVVISKAQCTLPVNDIQNKSVLFYSPSQSCRSSQLDIVGITSITCDLTLANIKFWVIDQCSPGTGQPLTRLTNVTSLLPTVWNAQLSVLPLFLAYGLYRFTYMVNVTVPPYSTTAFTYVEITATPIVALLVPNGMSMITKGYGSDITISPANFSYDPDLPPGQNQTFSNFIWFCREMNEFFPLNPDGTLSTAQPSVVYTAAELASMGTSTKGGCFRQGPGAVQFNGGSLTFSSYNMRPNDTYIFQVTVVIGTRNSTGVVMVNLANGNPPDVEIGCVDALLCTPLTQVLRVNPSNRLALYSNCTSNCQPNMVYQWTAFRLGLNQAWLPIYNFSAYVSGVSETSSPQIAISDQFFSDGFAIYINLVSYKIGVTISSPGGGVSGTSYIELLVNIPPSGGICTVTPTSGVADQILFALSCNDWYDTSGIALYQFYGDWRDTANSEVQLGYCQTGYLSPMALPQGSPTDNYYLNVYARIIDSFGAIQVYNISLVQVTEISKSSCQNLVDQLLNNVTNANKLGVIAADGDVIKTSEVFVTYADALNANMNYDIAGYGNTSSYPNPSAVNSETYQNDRNNRANIRGQMIQTIANVTVSSIEAIQLVSSTLNKITRVTSEINREDQETATNVLSNMYQTMTDISSRTPLEDMDTATQTILSTAGNLLESINYAEVDPTELDLEQAKTSKPYYYDTNYESLRAAFVGQSQTVMLGGLLHETNTIVQKQSASTTVPSLLDTVDGISHLLLSKTVAGEEPLNMTSPGMSLFLQKDSPSQICNRTISVAGGSSVTLPVWCDISPPSINCSSGQPISIKISSTPENVFDHFSNSADVATNSETVSVDMMDADGNVMPIANTQQPLKIVIPRTNQTPPVAQHEASYMSTQDNSSLFYYKFNVSNPGASIHVVIHPDIPVQFLIFARYQTFPEMDGPNKGWDFIQNLPISMANISQYYAAGIDPYTFFVSNAVINNRAGVWYIGLKQLNVSEYDEYSQTNTPAPPPRLTGRFTTNYTMFIYTSGCYYCQNDDSRWSTQGCTVSPQTSVYQTVCLCNHLTNFGAAYIVQPNTIDFNFIFTHSSFLSNPTIYITEMIVGLAYLIVFIWARRQDKKDVMKIGVTPLMDNDPRDRYLYQVTVCTGLRRNAGTESKVHMIISGDYDETDARTFEDDERKVFRRGTTDNFLIAVPRPLGPLNYARIWHDNSGKGKFASWYMNWMIIRDVQTEQKFQFIVNQWFAVEEDDGQISRLVPVCGHEQMTETVHLFSRKTTEGFSDEHLWFSVAARPVVSRFTRCQRLSCCLCLLFTVMLADAMFYGMDDDPSDEGVDIGPFNLAPRHVYIALICNLVVFPINFIIAFLFKNSRPRYKRPSKITQALRRMMKRYAVTDNTNDEHISYPENAWGEAMAKPNEAKEKEDFPAHHNNRPQSARSAAEDDDENVLEKDAEKVKKCCEIQLPWWCVIVGWIVLWLTVGVAVAFVTFYGIMFQDAKCRKWITAFIISFMTDIFVKEPVKIILLALLFSMIFKKPHEEEEGEEDEEEIELENDEIWLHTPITDSDIRIRRKVVFQPPDPIELEKARRRRMQELEMYSILREVLAYCFFLWLMIFVSYDFRDPRSQLVKSSVQTMLVDGGRGVNATPSTSIDLMTTMENFWDWTNQTFIPGLLADVWYNGDQPVGLRGYLNDKLSRIMGYATMRQLRVKRDMCSVPWMMHTRIAECNVPYSPENEDTATYGVGWTPVIPGENLTLFPEYQYTSGSELDGYPYWATHAVYGAGGYVVDLRGNRQSLYAILANLKEGGWVDRYTRAIFLEFTAYNVQVNLFVSVTMVAELLTSGGFDCYYYFEPMNLIGYTSGADTFMKICQCLYLLFIVLFIIRESRNIWKTGIAYLQEFWNWVELWIISMSIGCLIIFIYRYIETDKKLKLFAESGGNAYMKFQSISYWNETMLDLVGLLVFWSFLKLIKLLRFNKIMGLLGSTLRYCANSLMNFSIMFCLLFFAFIHFFYLTYTANLESFSNIILASEQCLQMMFGKFDFGQIAQASPILGTFMFFMYMIVVFFILLTMFITIICEGFEAVLEDIHKQSNDHEMIDFLIDRFKQWTGIKTLLTHMKKHRKHKKMMHNSNHLDYEKFQNQIDNLPERLDRFLDQISQVYFQQDNFESIISNSGISGKKLRLGEDAGKKGMYMGNPPKFNPNAFPPEDRHLPDVDTP